MKEKLETLSGKIVQIDNAMQWLQLLKSPTEAHLKKWCEDGYSVIAQNIALLDSLIAELDSGEVSDGYHTFNELYEHRHALFALNIAVTPEISWKSLKHDDGTMFDGWFIAGMALPTGMISYHIPIRLWELFSGKELANAPKWDGHTSNDVIKRIVTATRDRE